MSAKPANPPAPGNQDTRQALRRELLKRIVQNESHRRERPKASAQ